MTPHQNPLEHSHTFLAFILGLTIIGVLIAQIAGPRYLEQELQSARDRVSYLEAEAIKSGVATYTYDKPTPRFIWISKTPIATPTSYKIISIDTVIRK
jgi:hypothetical protein